MDLHHNRRGKIMEKKPDVCMPIKVPLVNYARSVALSYMIGLLYLLLMICVLAKVWVIAAILLLATLIAVILKIVYDWKFILNALKLRR
jgi:hypothetical protein